MINYYLIYKLQLLLQKKCIDDQFSIIAEPVIHSYINIIECEGENIDYNYYNNIIDKISLLFM